jgi:hypothetical protein
VYGQLSGSFFYKKYPYCPISAQDIIKTSDGVCDGGVLNTIGMSFDFRSFCRLFFIKCPSLSLRLSSFLISECGFDDGDCISFNFGYPNCFAAGKTCAPYSFSFFFFVS